MAAGESAYGVARRQREKAARLERSAALWEQGAVGEVEVARVLEALPPGWIVLHDLAWPGRPRANMDHVVIGPGGVFVVDAKNWSGTIEVQDHVLKQNGRQREQTVSSAAECAIALQRTLPVSHLCRSVLCFVGDNTLSGWARDVMVCSSSNLVTMLLSRPDVLGPDEVERCAAAVRRLPTQRSAAATRATSSTAKRKRRPIAKVVVALTFLALLGSGSLVSAAGWVGQQMTEVIAGTVQPEPTPSPQDVEKRKGRSRDSPRGTRSSG